MIGTGIGLGLAGYRLRTSFEAMPSLDLQFADRRMIQAVLGPTPSFSRASTGAFFNSQGVLNSAAINGPRFNHVYNGTSWVSRGLLLEEQRTNSAQYSEDFTNAYWTKAGLSVNGNNANAPDGNLTADKFVETAANSQHTLYNSGFSVVSGTAYTISFFAKAAGRNFIQFPLADVMTGASSNGRVNFDLSNGTIGQTVGTNLTAEIIDVGNGWYRCICKLSSAASNGTGYLQFNLVNSGTATPGQAYLGDGTSGVLVWGIQLEAGSAFATSYIPSLSNSSTTRSADVCQITGSDFSGFWNGAEGSVACEFDVSSGYTSSAMTIANFYQSGSSWIGFRSIESTSNNVFDCYSGGVQQARLGFSRSNPGISARLAAAFKANDFAASQNGSAVLTDTSGSLPSPTYLELGTFTGFGEYLNGHIARLRYYPTRLANAKLQELST